MSIGQDMRQSLENKATGRKSAALDESRSALLFKLIAVGSGAALLAALVLLHDAGSLLHQVSDAGAGLLVVSLLAPIFWVFSAEAWRTLFEKSDRPDFMGVFRATAIASAVNTLLPVLSIGGDIVKARFLMQRGWPGCPVIATVWVDKTVQAVTMVLWAITGLLIWTVLTRDPMILASSVSGVAVLTLGIAGFVAVQHLSPNSRVMNLSRYLSPKSPSQSPTNASGDADSYLRNCYRRPLALIRAILLRYSGRAILVLEITIVGLLLGLYIPLLDAVVIAGLVYAARGIGFAVPARLGIQEGGYIAAGSFLGYAGETMLVIALAARLREFGAHAPVLVAWHYNLLNRTKTKRVFKGLSAVGNRLHNGC